MPGQYYEGVRRDDPATGAIKRLMLAVLEDALRCLQTHAEAPKQLRQRLWQQTFPRLAGTKIRRRSRRLPRSGRG